MSTPTKTYTDPTEVETHLATCASEGIKTRITANNDFVVVETTTRWGSNDCDIFLKSNGKKITSFTDIKKHLRTMIMISRDKSLSSSEGRD